MVTIPFDPAAMLAQSASPEARIASLEARRGRTVDELRALRADAGRIDGKVARLEGNIDRAFVILASLAIAMTVGLAGLVAKVGQS